MDTRKQGGRWERVAESFLKGHGLKTLERNFRGRFGEIDLILLDGQTLVFTEVRFRTSSSHGSGADSVTRIKQQRIIRVAEYYLQRHARHRGRSCRFDVVSIGTQGGLPELRWIRAAFTAE